MIHKDKASFGKGPDFMRQAIALSRKAIVKGSGGPFGALVVGPEGVVGEGYNQVIATADPTAHAEVVAIRSACSKRSRFHLEDCELYSSCEPCPMCLGAILWARIKTVYFASTREDAAAVGFDDALFYRTLTVPRREREIAMRQLLREEALPVLRDWSEMAERVSY